MEENKKKRLQYKELKPAARKAIKDILERKKEEGLIIPDHIRNNLTLGTIIEDDRFIFELYVPGKKPQNAVVYVQAEASRIDGIIKTKIFEDAFI